MDFVDSLKKDPSQASQNLMAGSENGNQRKASVADCVQQNRRVADPWQIEIPRKILDDLLEILNLFFFKALTCAC